MDAHPGRENELVVPELRGWMGWSGVLGYPSLPLTVVNLSPVSASCLDD